MNSAISLHFREIKQAGRMSGNKNGSQLRNDSNSQTPINDNVIGDKDYLTKKRERETDNLLFKSPLELSTGKKNLIAQILSKKQSSVVLPSKPINKISVIQPSTLSIVNKVMMNKGITQLQLSSSQPKLSQKTLNILEELKQDRKNRFERSQSAIQLQPSRSESSFSLRLRNEELLKDERELPLPSKYKLLMNSFIALDNSINYFKQINQTTVTFDQLKEAIETAEKHRFTIEVLQQILYIVPHLYVLKWEKGRDSYELLIDIPHDYDKRIKEIQLINGDKTDMSQIDFNLLQRDFKGIIASLKQNELEIRRKVFKNIVLQLTNEEHKLFLLGKQSDYPAGSFDAIKLKTWHHSFDLNNVKDIPHFTIDPKPQFDSLNSYNQCIRDNDIKSILIKKAMEEGLSGAIEKDGDMETIEVSKLNHNISLDLLKKIKMKEDAIKISQEIQEMIYQKNAARNSIEELKDLAMKIGNIFLCRDNCPLNELISNLIKNPKENELKSLKEKLMSFNQKFPQWFKIIKHSSLGDVVVIDQSININDHIIPNLSIN